MSNHYVASPVSHPPHHVPQINTDDDGYDDSATCVTESPPSDQYIHYLPNSLPITLQSQERADV